MKVRGWQKTSLIDFPDKVATTLFSGGCNFKCPYCHNKDLVFIDDGNKHIDHEEIMNYLEKRQGLIDGVCISGGEPTLEKNLISFAKKIKEKNMKVKLDTNGYNPDVIEEMISMGLVDYIAMDVKNSFDRYAETSGLKEMDLSKIQRSIELIKNCGVDHEFRTTVVKEFHNDEDIEKIGTIIEGANNFYIQRYDGRSDQIKGGYKAHSKEELANFKKIASKYIKNVKIRGA